MKVLDNFLDRDDFNRIFETFCGPDGVPWFLSHGVSREGGPDGFYFIHHLYYGNESRSEYIDVLNPLFRLIDPKALIRAKGNLYPQTSEVHGHGFHRDQDYSHKGCILYLNTCDGYTGFEDGTMVESVSNRVLLFDSSTMHQSTTCTNDAFRCVININYF